MGLRIGMTWPLSVAMVLAGIGGDAARALPLGGVPAEPPGKPGVTEKFLRPQEIDWTPLSGREHPILPDLREVMDNARQGGPQAYETVVRTAYRRIADYVRNDHQDIDFQLSGFTTLYTPDVLALKYGDVISSGLPDRIAITGMTREKNVNGRTVSVTRSYQARWEPSPAQGERKTWESRSMREYVQAALDEQPALARLHAVTTYRVAVTFQGVRREYRAAFLWMREISGPAVETFGCIDPVTDRVAWVLAELVPPEGKILESEKSGALGSITQPAAFGTCEVTTSYLSTNMRTMSGPERHLGGYYHVSESEFDISCHCSSYCESICYPSLQVQGCYDEGGTTGGYHVPATDTRIKEGHVQDALGLSGASCEGTYACAFAQCQNSGCLFTISLGPTGPGITSNPAGAAFWTFSPTTTGSCTGCQRRTGDSPPDPEIPKVECPLLLALDGARLDMTNVAGGVRFDLNRDGVAEALSWPASDSAWAFVVLDRNANGRIDDGGELFGNYTAQPPGDDPNGYAALAEFDQSGFGGNGNGDIDSQDAIFNFLLLWVDRNHDGESQTPELIPLENQVATIGLAHKESRARDRYGNQFRYRGTALLANGRKSHSVDVFLLTE